MTGHRKLPLLSSSLALARKIRRPSADAQSADIMGSMSAVVSEYFVEPAPDFTHRDIFRVDALPETDELVAPFV